MNKNMDALSILKREYIPYISELIVSEFGRSYQVASQTPNAWRTQIPFSNKIAEHIILHTKVFIRMHPDKNLDNLKGVIKQISDYLSKYFACENGCSPEKIPGILFDTLYINFDYIQNLARKEFVAARKNATAKQTEAKKSKRKRTYANVTGTKHDFNQHYDNFQTASGVQKIYSAGFKKSNGK